MGNVDRRSLGSFNVDGLGRISLMAGRQAGFRFQWRGRIVSLAIRDAGTIGEAGAIGDVGWAGALHAGGVGTCRVRMSAGAGRIPSTATAAALRPDALMLARSMAAILPDGWSLRLRPDHMLQLDAEETLPLPALIGELLLPATRFAIQLGPYLDLLEEHGMTVNA